MNKMAQEMIIHGLVPSSLDYDETFYCFCGQFYRKEQEFKDHILAIRGTSQ
jgi:hypothetical protein